jgi:drug/metabolite transporter (DMT)-like permease
MKELITRPQTDAVMIGVAALGLILATLMYLTAKRRGENGAVSATLWGGPPLLAALLWPVYNAITDRIGLDRVANLFVNLALFVVVGAAAGWAWIRMAAGSENGRKETDEAAPKA